MGRSGKAAVLALMILAAAFCRVRMEPRPAAEIRGKIVELARSLIGLPYKFGGSDIDGFDCSGLVHYVYASFGIELPRSASQQSRLRPRISLERAQPGDILFFKFGRRWHAAIYLGGTRFVHAPNEASPIREESLSDYYRQRLQSISAVLDR